MKVTFAVIGYGWRADFFYRIAKELPEQFEICAGVLRTQQRAAQVEKEKNVFATSNLEEALNKNPDFVVLCIPRQGVKDYLVQLMEKKVAVLCETPPAKNVEELNELWIEKERLNGKIQVLEQYHLQPLYYALTQIVNRGILGKTSNVTLSALHGYHGVSIFRKLLNLNYENCKIQGKKFNFPIIKTNSRAGFTYEGNEISAQRELITLEFENGKVAIYDFSPEQYFSTIRTRRVTVQGIKGEINDMIVRYLDEENRVVEQEVRRKDLGVYDATGWHHKGMYLGSYCLYENPTAPGRLNDDEIAIADCLIRMKKYVETGEMFYSLEEALQDTYLSFMMEESVKTGQCIETQKQIWADK